MRKEINIKKAAEKIMSVATMKGEADAVVKMGNLILEVLLDIREKLCKQNDMIRRNGRT